MATEQYPQVAPLQSDFNRNQSPLEKWRSLSSDIDESESNPSGGFDCNICLDQVQEPVVTFCGHLYCWPCIYRWINSQNVSSEEPEPREPQCPVCKAEISEKTLIPLYSHGKITNKSSKDKDTHVGIFIPQRPPSPRCGGNMLIPNTANGNPDHVHHLHRRTIMPQSQPHNLYPGNYTVSPMLTVGGTTNLPDPMIGMFGEMVYARIFGNSETALYTYPNSYHLGGSNSPRVRRHMIQTDESLSRVCFFLCCCVMLCLLLF